MDLDYNAITALSAVIASIVAILAIWAESRNSRFALGVDILTRLDDRFNDKDWWKKRGKAAMFLLDKSNTHRFEKANADIDDILDFFEMIGLLTNLKALDPIMVWNTFSYLIYGYYNSAKEYINLERKRKNDPLMWENLEKLYTKLEKIETEKRLEENPRLSEITWNKILEEEAAL